MQPTQINEKDLRKIVRSGSPWERFWSIFWRSVRQLVYIVLLFCFFFVALNYGAYWQQAKYFFQNHSSTPVTVAKIAPPSNSPLPNYAPSLSIPKIGITAPIVMNIPLADVHADLEEGVVHVQGSALPGEVGNVVIFGHSSDYVWNPGNYRNIFALLNKLSVGDQISLPYKSQQFIYQVTGSQVVAPTDLAVIDKTNSPTLTLITCWPVGTSSKRLVVTATLVSGQITGTQITSPNGSSLPAIR
jgi:sortase A